MYPLIYENNYFKSIASFINLIEGRLKDNIYLCG
uniref:Uncharacterized protein n=1 Tax=Lepeophtheirus salmonis TaxID=72036 RepID=A0A0K2TVY7_LEPSM